MKLTILTPAITERKELRRSLFAEIQRQIEDLSVEHVVLEDDGEIPVGEKMGRAFQNLAGEYVCVIDDDDLISPKYIAAILAALESGPDVVTFQVWRPDTNKTWDLRAGKADGLAISEDRVVMMANHLCVWRTELAQRVPWLPLRYASDVFWYQILNRIKPDLTEVRIPEVLYQYRFNTEKTRNQRPLDCALTTNRCAGGIDGWRHVPTGELVVSSFGRAWQPKNDFVVIQDRWGEIRAVRRYELELLCTTELR